MIRFLQTPGKKKYILGALLMLICAAMVITLIPGGFLGNDSAPTRSGVLAKVGSEEVTYQETVAMSRRMLQQRFGPQQTIPDELIRMVTPQAMDQLVDSKVLLFEAQRMGLGVTVDELRKALMRNPMIAPDGKFIGDAAYEQLVRQQTNMSVADFERSMREEMVIGKLIAVVASSATVSDADIQQEFRRRNTKVKFDYAVLSLEDVQKQVQVDENALRGYFDKNKARFENSLPERRRIEYVHVDAAQLPSAKATDTDIQRAYNERQDEFRVAERVNVRHILIKTPPAASDGKVDENAVNAARTKAEGVLKQLQGGAKFADVAKKVSEDVASAQNGGSLGWIERGRTVPEFEKAAFSLEKGKLSNLVQSSYGFHILMVDDKQPARLRPLEEVRAEIEPQVAREKAYAEMDRLAGSLQNTARTGGVDAAARQLNQGKTTTDWIARTDALPGLGAAPEMLEAAFGMGEKDAPEVVRTQNGLAVVRVVGIQPPSTPTFEQARSRVEQEYRQEQSRSLLSQKLQQLADRARAQHDLRAAAKEVGATVKTSEPVSVEQQVADLGSMNTEATSGIFGLNKGAIAGPIPTARGGAVVAILDKQEANLDEIATQRERLREELLGRKRSMSFQIFKDNLRKRMEQEGKVHIYKEELDRLAPQRKQG